MRIALTFVLLACFTTPLAAQRPRAKQDAAHIKLIEAALNLVTEVVKASEAAYQKKELEDKIVELEQKLRDRELQLSRAIQENKRVAERFKLLEADFDKRLIEVQAAIKAGNARIAERLEMQRKLFDLLTAPDRNLNEPNPPPVLVNGKIEKIDEKDGTLIQISLGTNHGVNKDHTLDVYRAQPEAKYLGMIRIVESYQHKSVGRLIGNPAARPQLKVGDSVTSKIAK